MKKNEYSFFLSYSRDADKGFIDSLVIKLESYGFRIWRDIEDVVLGKDIYTGLHQTLNNCKSWSGIITIIDETYLYKTWCIKELDYAVENNIPIYPVLLHITKKDIPRKYHELKRLNLCTITKNTDLNYAIYKVILRFLSDYLETVQFNNILSQSLILDNLVNSFKYSNKNNESIVFKCDNIAMCINYLLKEKNYCFGNHEIIIYNLIHNSVRDYYITSCMDRLQIRIIVKATDCLLYRYYYS